MEQASSESRGPMEDAERLLNQYTADMNEAELYLESNERLQAACLAGVAVLFNCLKNNSRHLPTGPLRQLYTADFDEDQVWEELQLVNEPALLSVSRVVSGMKTDLQQLLVVAAAEEECVLEENEVGMGERETSRTEDDEDENEGESDGGWESEREGEGEEGEGESEEEEGEGEEDSEVHKRSKVDDDFFSYSAMEQYLERSEELIDSGSEGSVGAALAEGLSDSGGDQLHYKDFFDPPQAVAAGERAGEREQLSAHEQKQLRLARQIARLEEDNMKAKSWQMSGETGSKDRPINSLLEEAVEFDPMTAPAPIVSEETTQSIEDIIRQRILDQMWDDVQRKVKPPEKPYDYRKTLPLNQEKSKRSLAEVYEEEYISQTHEAADQPTEDPRHVEVEELRKKLFLKLDALSNFSFTPKPPQSELCVVGNVSAVAMEEVTPSATAQHTLLAPEEVQPKLRAPEKGHTERTSADRQRQRLAKKRLKRRRGVGLGRTLVPGSKGQQKRQKSSSRDFFTSLQQKTKDHNISTELHKS